LRKEVVNSWLLRVMKAVALATEAPVERPRLTVVEDTPPPFAEFYEAYHARLLRFVRRRFASVDAEEVAQEAMIRAMTHYEDLDPRRDPWPWLSVIASNVARDFCRSRQRHPLVDLESQEELVDVLSATPDELAESMETALMLRAALRALPAHQRALLLLREADGMEIYEIAEMFGNSTNTIRQQLLRARRRLLAEYLRLEEAAAKRHQPLGKLTSGGNPARARAPWMSEAARS